MHACGMFAIINVIFNLCGVQGKMDDLQLFRGDFVLLKGKKRKETVSFIK